MQASLRTDLEDSVFTPSSPESVALQHLVDAGFPLVPTKRGKGETQPNKKPKRDVAAVRLYSVIPIHAQAEAKEQKKQDEEQATEARILSLLPQTLPPPITPDKLIQMILHLAPLVTLDDQNKFIEQIMHGFEALEGSTVRV
jgi:hypothetical protein